MKTTNLADSMAHFVQRTLVDSEAVNCLNQQTRPETKVLRNAIKQLRLELQRASYYFDPEPIADDQ
ncbi:CDP-diacylglycerol--serine O-phosphatidyltransferase, partial [Halomonas sp. SIMBA_159]